jgi:predicted Zn-dependent protease
MTGRDEFRFLADLVLKRSSADQTVVNLYDQHSGTTRFASSRIIQNVDTRRGTLTVTVAFDGHRGSASTTDFSAGSVQDTLARAERIARVSPEDPEYLPPPDPQIFPTLQTSRDVWNMRMKPSDSAVLKILKPPVLSPLLSPR